MTVIEAREESNIEQSTELGEAELALIIGGSCNPERECGGGDSGGNAG